MVVDDSITVRRVTQRLLERNGMRVLTARDGMDAVALLQDNVPDVILLDIEMPRMDGYEVAAHVRNDPRLKDVPIIMITSRVGEKHRARAIELGVDDYLGKPYQEAQLLDAIAPLVERRRAAQRATPALTGRLSHGRTRRRDLQPAGPAGRRAADHPARLRRGGGRLPDALGDDRGAAVVHRHRAWNGTAVPLVSFEGACGQMIPPASGRTRIVMLHRARHADRGRQLRHGVARASRSWCA